MISKILIRGGFFFICNLGFSQKSSSVVTAGYTPEGILSKPHSYSILKSGDFRDNTHVELTSSIFPKLTEFLNECSAHWSSNAVEVELHGDDHDYFTLRIVIFEKKYQAEFHWISDGHLDSKVTIEPTSCELSLSSDDFKKGPKYHGTINFTGVIKGNVYDYDGKNVKLSGHFTFKIP